VTVTLIDTWRRPACDSRCWRGAVKVVGEQQVRMLEVHDADAHDDYHRNVVEIGPLRIDWRTGTASVLSMPIVDLTRREWSVLAYLGRHPGLVIPHQEIVEAVWGESYLENWRETDTILRQAVSRLKGKLWEASPLIETVRSRGYRLRTSLPNTEVRP